MREVGGYKQLMDLPIPAIKEIVDFLNWESKEMEKKTKRGGRFR
jgi:hypothetical protein